MIGRRSPASSSFVLAAQRLRALQLDPSNADGLTYTPARGRAKKNGQASLAATRSATGPVSYGPLTTSALMGAADRV
jgi:hypothetical protein